MHTAWSTARRRTSLFAPRPQAIHARQYYSPDNGSLFPVDGSVGNLAALGAAAAAASGTPSSSAAGQAGASLMSSVGLGGGMLAHSAAGGGLQDGMSGVVEQQLRFYARFILVCIMLSRKEVRLGSTAPGLGGAATGGGPCFTASLGTSVGARTQEAVNLLQEFQALVAAHTMGLEPGSQQHAHVRRSGQQRQASHEHGGGGRGPAASQVC